MDLPLPSFVFHSSLLTVKSVDSVVARDGFLFVTEISSYFHTAYFDYTVAFQILLDLYGVTKCNGYFAFLHLGMRHLRYGLHRFTSHHN